MLRVHHCCDYMRQPHDSVLGEKFKSFWRFRADGIFSIHFQLLCYLFIRFIWIIKYYGNELLLQRNKEVRECYIRWSGFEKIVSKWFRLWKFPSCISWRERLFIFRNTAKRIDARIQNNRGHFQRALWTTVMFCAQCDTKYNDLYTPMGTNLNRSYTTS
jgi:hypothetical protein